MIGYKVVSHDLKSAIISTCIKQHDSKYGVQYCLGMWTVPKNPQMPLMVFDSLREAKYFLRYDLCDCGQIFECEYIKSKRKWGWCLNSIDEILEIKRKKKRMIFRKSLPPSTVLADKVKLTKRIF